MECVAIDLGNTSCTFGRLRRGNPVRTLTLPTAQLTPGRIRKIACLRSPVSPALIASVVPSKNAMLQSVLKSLGYSAVYLIGKDLPVPIRNLTRHPSQVGVDRLIVALEAFRLLRRACVVIDFGTAITLDVVSSKGDYLGGIIAPGVELSINSLYERTALLPKIRLIHPRSIIGKSTIESLRSGCSYGLGALCDGLIEEINRSTHKQHQVLATGGYDRYMKRYMKTRVRVDDHLVLKGIYTVAVKTLAL